MTFLFVWFLSSFGSVHASTDVDVGSWNSVIVSAPIQETRLSFEHEIRYSDELRSLSQEQYKFLLRTDVNRGELGFGFNYRTEDVYSINTEKRFLVQYEQPLIKHINFEHDARLRFELRDFVLGEKFAQRVRLRNFFLFKKAAFYNWVPSVSSEFNFYINETSVTQTGFYSHRTILAATRFFSKSWALQVKYVNDFKRNKNEPQTLDHVVGLELIYSLPDDDL